VSEWVNIKWIDVDKKESMMTEELVLPINKKIKYESGSKEEK
jgi:hypothetical protein